MDHQASLNQESILYRKLKEKRNMAAGHEKLTITPEAVREAAKTCPDAEKVLKTLFPKAFEPPPIKLIWADRRLMMANYPYTLAEIRTGGNLAGKALWLNIASFHFDIVKDNMGVTVLLPTKK